MWVTSNLFIFIEMLSICYEFWFFEQNLIGHNREDPLTAPQWPNLNQPPDLGTMQYSDGNFESYRIDIGTDNIF